jgi:micrococcal nuclease
MFEYRAKVKKVYDGDTITVDIDLGFGVVLKNQKIRLLNINTPEVKGSARKEGLFVRDNLREKILNKKIILKTHRDKKGKYGRWLGEVFLEGTSINEWLISEGHGCKY